MKPTHKPIYYGPNTVRPKPTDMAKLARYLFEDGAPLQADPPVQTVGGNNPAASTLPQNISLDQRVDSYFVEYERESTPNPPQMTPQSNVPTPNLPESRRRKTNNKVSMAHLLFEADEPPTPPGGGGDDDEDPAAPPTPPDDGGAGTDPLGGLGGPGDDPTGGGGGNGAPGAGPPPVRVPKLNIQVFATRIARLVGNYEALLDPRTIILNRAEAYVAANYSPRMAKELMNNLQLNFNLSTKNMQSQPGMDAPPMSGAGIGDMSSAPSSAGTVSSS